MDDHSRKDRPLPAGATGVVLGFRAVVSGTNRVLTDRALRKLAIVPIIITVLLYLVLFGASIFYVDDLLDLLWAKPTEGWTVFVWYAAWAASLLAAMLVLFLLFATLVEAIGGPFYDKMVMHILKQNGIPCHEPGWIMGTVPDLFRALLLLGLTLVCSVLGIIPIIGLPFSIMGVLLVWFSLALGAINPVLLVTGRNLGSRFTYATRSFGTTMGVGATIALSLFVPLLGLISIPGAVVGVADLYSRRAVSSG